MAGGPPFSQAYPGGFSLLSASILGIFLLVHLLSPGPEIPDGQVDLKVAHFNVYVYNEHHEEIVRQALATDADLLSFQEVVNAAWSQSLSRGLGKVYPYYHIVPRENPFGMAVFSRYPIEGVEEFEWQQLPNIAGMLRHPGGTVRFVASHTSPPTRPNTYERRNAHLREIAGHLNTFDGPKLALGDFNIVPWSPQIDSFKIRTRMYDSRKGIDATFPAQFLPARVPIDYIFHSEEISCVDFRTLESAFGSPGDCGDLCVDA